MREVPQVIARTSLIIATRGRPALVHDTLRSVASGREVPEEFVVLDQSALPHPELAQMDAVGQSRLTYVHSKSIGLSRARNEGIDAAAGDLLAFLDDDMFVDPGWFGALIGTLERLGPRWAVSGRVVQGAPEAGSVAHASTRGDEHARRYTGRVRGDHLTAGNMAVHRTMLLALGEFDPRLGAGSRFPAAEDNDYGYRLLEAGYGIAYEPTAVAHHRAWRSEAQFLPHRWTYGVGQGAFYAKHASLRDRHVLTRFARHVLGKLARLPALALRDRRRARGDVVFVAGLVAGFGRWSVTERRRSFVALDRP
jgi:GT2 family glycosyltransferase